MDIGRFFSTEGRINRLTYLGITFGSLVLVFVLAVFDVLLGTYDEETGYGALTIVGGLVVFWPGIATNVKRFHDFGKSGWMVLLMLIPLVGFIVTIVLLFSRGDDRFNEHGEKPNFGFAP